MAIVASEGEEFSRQNGGRTHQANKVYKTYTIQLQSYILTRVPWVVGGRTVAIQGQSSCDGL
jgi:hypothetical protein